MTSKTFRPFCYLRGFCEWDTQPLLGAPIEALNFDCLSQPVLLENVIQGVVFCIFQFSILRSVL